MDIDIELAAILLFFILILIAWPAMKIQRILFARRIMSRGGPCTFFEYNFLFPDACSECGGRVIIETEQETIYIDGGSSQTASEFEYQCKRCGHIISDTRSIFSWAPFGDPIVTETKVCSPYLTAAESNAIPEWHFDRTSR